MRCKKNIVHIPEVLFCSDGEISYLPVQKEVLKRHLLISKFLEPFDKSVQHPLISIIIPNKDHVEILRQCITSILEKSTYDWYEILVIENNSTKQETFDYYNRLEQETKVRVITCVTDWNYSYINNFGAKEAKGEYLLFLNNEYKSNCRRLAGRNAALCCKIGCGGSRRKIILSGWYHSTWRGYIGNSRCCWTCFSRGSRRFAWVYEPSYYRAGFVGSNSGLYDGSDKGIS